MFLKLLEEVFLNGPPDAVIKRFNMDVVFAVVENKAVMIPVKVVGFMGINAAVAGKGRPLGRHQEEHWQADSARKAKDQGWWQNFIVLAPGHCRGSGHQQTEEKIWSPIITG